MDAKDAKKLAIESLEGLDEEGASVADTTCVFLQPNGKYTVTDNGEEVADLDRENAIRIIVENLTA
jgi:hypothetical protein